MQEINYILKYFEIMSSLFTLKKVQPSSLMILDSKNDPVLVYFYYIKLS